MPSTPEGQITHGFFCGDEVPPALGRQIVLQRIKEMRRDRLVICGLGAGSVACFLFVFAMVLWHTAGNSDRYVIWFLVFALSIQSFVSDIKNIIDAWRAMTQFIRSARGTLAEIDNAQRGDHGC